jgi:prevent-host-death family protein
MKVTSLAEIKSKFGDFLKATQSGPIVITRNGRPAAVIIGVQDEEEIERLVMAYSPQVRAILDRSRKQFREGKWLSEDEFWSQFKQGQSSKRPRKLKRKGA